MNLNAADDNDDALTLNSRAMARRIAFDMVMENLVPNAEVVRKRIIEETNKRMNPSANTIQSEIKQWMADSFWPTYHAFGALPADSSVPQEVRRIYQTAFQSMTVKLLETAHAGWEGERAQFQLQLNEADVALGTAKRQVSEFENKAAEALDQLQAEATAHATARQLNADLLSQIATLNRDIQAASARQAEHEREVTEMREAERLRIDGIMDAHNADRTRIVLELDAVTQKAKRLESQTAKAVSETHAWRERATKAEIELKAARDDALRQHAAQQAELDRVASALRESQSAIAASAARRAPVVARDRPARPVRNSLRKATFK